MYPHTIDNGHGERLTFLGLDGDRSRVASEVDPGAGPPMHVHRLQTESMRVDSGRIGTHGGRPGAFDAAFLLTRYRSEFTLTEIPAAVRRFVLPLQASGRLLRRYQKYADAPEPVIDGASAKLPRRSATSARSSAG